LKIRHHRKSSFSQANLEPVALQRAARFFIEWATRVQSSRFTFSRFPMRSHKDAQGGLLHLNSAPNEATTSIWLKAMMVRSDLNEGSPTGGAPRGESGLILPGERSASALYLRGNLHAG
jgi:hypothetical protein